MDPQREYRRSSLRFLASSPIVAITTVSLAQIAEQFAIPKIT
jgi:hypothetical protein